MFRCQGSEAVCPGWLPKLGRVFFDIFATFAEFEAGPIRLRTREGMAIARARGKLRRKQPKLSGKQQRKLRRMHIMGDYSIRDLAELFSISRPTVYRTSARQGAGLSRKQREFQEPARSSRTKRARYVTSAGPDKQAAPCSVLSPAASVIQLKSCLASPCRAPSRKRPASWCGCSRAPSIHRT